MRGTDMAEPSRRRRAGDLAGMILRLLQRSQTPLAGIGIADRLRRKDARVSNSLVFRALGQLREDGMIRKIEHLNGYAAGGETRRVSLVCSKCGKLVTLEAEGFFEALDGLAGRHGFRPSRYVVEFGGRCACC
jgi:Fe2+ or Zn2+ uptake regulation protein